MTRGLFAQAEPGEGPGQGFEIPWSAEGGLAASV